MILDFYNQEYMKRWACEKIGIYPDFSLCTAIGVVKDNKLICVVLYSNYIESPNGEPISIEISIASVDKSWCTKHNICALLSYPFIQLGLKRVQATVAKRNKHARRFLQRLGFKLEGIGRKAWPLGGDCAVYSLLKDECRWIQNGQKHPLSTSGARSSSNG